MNLRSFRIIYFLLFFIVYNSIVAQVGRPALISVERFAGITSNGGSTFGDKLLAKLNEPIDMAITPSGVIYIAEEGGSSIKIIDLNGVISSLAGSSGTTGFVDGTGSSARFNQIRGIALDTNGNLIVADKDNHAIRKVTPAGVVTTLAGSMAGFQDGNLSEALFNKPIEILVDNSNNIYVADALNFRVRKIDSNGMVTTIAGRGISGYADGDIKTATLDVPSDFAFDSKGDLIIATYHAVRRLNLSTNQLTTIVGGATATTYADGDKSVAGFDSLNGLLLDEGDIIYVIDRHSIRHVTEQGFVTTISGNSTQGVDNGPPLTARFHFPRGIVKTSEGNFLVADKANHVIRKINLGPGVRISSNATSHNGSSPIQVTFTFNKTVNNFTASDVTTNNGSISNFSGSGSIYTADITPTTNRTITLDVTAAAATDLASNPNTAAIQFSVPLDQNNPIFTSATTATFLENGTGTAYTATATDDNTITYSLGTSNDEALFDIVGTSGIVTFKASPDFEAPTDGNTDNDYVIEVKASDGVNTNNQTVTITVTNILDEIPPVFTSGTTESFTENGTGTAYTAAASDANTITYNLGTSNDEALFDIVETSGAVTFKASPDFETPADADTNNDYVIEIKASDEINTASLIVTIDVLNSENVAPQFSSIPTLTVNNNATYQYAVTAKDFDGDDVNITSTKIPNWLSLSPGQIEVLTIAGDGTNGVVNGSLAESSFANLTDVVIDSKGNIYVAEGQASIIRKISTSGEVTNFIGKPYQLGLIDGDSENALLAVPRGLAIDESDNIFVAENGYYSDGIRINAAIRKIDPLGNISLIAGGGNSESIVDGNGSDAKFVSPFDLTIDEAGNLFLIEIDENVIRKIDKSGNVTTLAGSGLRETVDGQGIQASFKTPSGITVDKQGNLYVVEVLGNVVRMIDPTGKTTTIAGNGSEGDIDDIGLNASFTLPTDISIDASGNLYISDAGNRKIKKIDQAHNVTTLAGTGNNALVDGTLLTSEFGIVSSIFVDQGGEILIADEGNHRLRKIAHVHKLSGSPFNLSGAFDVELSASDTEGGLSTQSFTITVNDVIAPVFASGLTENFAENGTSTAHTVAATDANDITYSLGTGSDEALFDIVGTSGVVTFKTAPDFEAPADADTDNAYVILVNASDGINTVSQTVTITVTNVDDTDPVFTSGITESFAENGTGAAHTVTATDANDITYSLGTANDEALFDIVGTSGIVTFKASPDFEASADGNTDNGYVIEVKASDGINTVSQTVTITVTDVNDNEPVITSNGGGQTASISVVENTTIITTVTATDIDALTPFFNFVAPGGDDESLFTIDLTSGELTWRNGAPDYENPLDQDQDNVYEIIVLAIDGPQATEGTFATSQSIKITVTNVDDTDPVFTSGITESFAENGTGTAHAVTATDVNTVTYSFGTENDEALFDIVGTSGIVTFKASPDFEAPADADTDNAYVIEVNASDGINTVSQTVTITVTNVDDTDPIFTSGITENFAENGTGTAHTVAATDANDLTYSLGTGNDEALFNIDGGSGDVTFKVSPDFEAPADADTNNDYVIEVKASDGLNISSQTVIVTVTNVNENPKITSQPITELNSDQDYEYVIEAIDPENEGINFKLINSSASWLSLVKETDYQVTTFAGSGTNGNTDGQGLNASFSHPGRMAIDDQSNIYVLDVWNNVIRRVDIEGNVSTIAGSGTNGYKDGNPFEAEFNGLSGIALDSEGNLYISDFYNNVIRKIAKDGVVSTFAGDGQPGFKDGTGIAARFQGPSGLSFDNSGNLYVADLRNNRIRKIDKNKVVTTLAGGSESRYLDGQGTDALFNTPNDLTVASDGNIYVTSRFRIRKITPSGLVTTFAGNHSQGSENGNGTEAKFLTLRGIASDNNGNLFIVDDTNTIRQVSPNAEVTTLVGSGVSNTIDGLGGKASFTRPFDIAITKNDQIYVTENVTNLIRLAKLPSPKLVGNPTGQSGDFQVILEATDINNESSTQSFTLKVIDVTNPVLTSPITANFVENGTGTAYTVVATDANAITYSLGTSNDEGLFDIVGTSGIVSFKASPDFEAPADADTDNIYLIEVKANDGINTASQTVLITITDVDEILPVFTSATAVNYEENGTGTVYTIAATDANSLTYSLGTGNDEALFDIDGTSGIMTFKVYPDFETPADANTDNAYVIQVNASDGINTAFQTVIITITDVDEILPVFTSTTAVNYEENGTGTVYTIAATDANAVTYSLGTGNDEALFDIDGTSGIVTFKASPDFEAPADADTNNEYLIEVKASDGINTVNQTVTITVTNVDDTDPVFTSGVVENFAENGTGTAYTAVATDANDVVYSLGNSNDEALFDIVGTSGVLTFKASPDFEAPADADTNNEYLIEVSASDGINTVSQTVAITVTNVDDTDPVFTSGITESFSENGTGTAHTVAATDANDITYTLGAGSDEALFDIVGTSGVVTFKTAPDFEAPADADTNNEYLIEVNASDGINTVSQTVTITVTNVDDTDPIFTSGITESFAENGTGTAHTVAATDANDITYSLGIANDEALFDIVGTSGVVTFKTAPDFEAPADADTNNEYLIEVNASDGINTVSQTVTITVTNVDDTDPVFTSGITESFAENGTGTAHTVAATDANDITYSLGATNDEALFDIVGTSGVVTFKTAPDFEAPADADTNNEYLIEVNASDGINTVSQTVTITVTNLDDTDPVFTSGVTENFAENGTGTAHIVAATDANDLTYSLGSANDEALFDIDETSGIVTFKAAPDFEAPADTDTNNEYLIEVNASDGVNTVSQTVTITVTNVDDTDPVFTSGITESFAENGTGTAHTVAATDANDITYSLGAPNDETLFEIVETSGIVTFKAVPDFETPADADTNNEYLIEVNASDGVNTVSQTVTITVTNVDDTDPVFTSGITESFAENGTGTAHTVAATDANDITYSLGAANDEALFDIVGTSGVVTFKAAPDFEAPVDVDTNNEYLVEVNATDGINTASQIVTITVTNVEEAFIRVTGDLTFSPTALGLTSTVDITIHNDGDADLSVSNITYPDGFSGVSTINVAAESNQVVTISFAPTEAKTYQGDITITSNGGEVTLSVNASGEIITAIDDELIDEEEINLYPNPVSQILNIDLSEVKSPKLDIELVNPVGLPIFRRKSYARKSLRIDVSGYPSGIYIIKFSNGKSVVYKKVIIKK